MIEHSYEAGVILKLLLDATAIPQCDLNPVEFDNANYREIYQAIQALSNRGETVDPVVVADYLFATTNQNWLPMLAQLRDVISLPADVAQYCQIIRRNNESRKACEIGQRLMDRASAEGTIDNAIRDLMAITLPNRRHQFEMGATLKLAVAELDAAHNGERQSISTGLMDLDEKLGGFHNGDLVVIGARPSMGKTALLLNMALAASGKGHPVGMFSGEQDVVQMGQRLLAIQGRIPVMRMRNGGLIEEDWQKLNVATHQLKDRQFQTDDTASPSLTHIVRHARSWCYGHNTKILFIDYLQRMDTDKRAKRYEAVGENVRGLKNLARELNIPVVVLAQVNREVEKRADKRPGMGDLSDSSEIEKEADQIFMLYRDEVYNQETKEPGIAEILIDKNRHGPTGFVRCIWRGECMRFENMMRAVS